MHNMIQLPGVTAASPVVEEPPMTAAGLFRGIVWENLGRSVDPKGSVGSLGSSCDAVPGYRRVASLVQGGEGGSWAGTRVVWVLKIQPWKLKNHKLESQGSDSFAKGPMEDDAAGRTAGGLKF